MKRTWVSTGLSVALLSAAILPAAESPPDAQAGARLERIAFVRDGGQNAVEGRVLTEAADGGLLVECADGRLWNVDAAELKSRESLDRPFRAMTADELGRVLKAEAGGDAEIVSTRHYVICTRAGKPFARYCGALFERLYAGFYNYWKQRGIELREPEFLLPAIVLADERQFAAFTTRDAGPGVADAKGYYSIGSNRIVLYDLTAGEGGAQTPAEITRRLAAAPFNIATVVHEATHQIAFNSGLHRRYADNPLWLTEGMAMFFETPDLSSSSGWKTIGARNDLRLGQFREYQAKGRPANSLATLVRSNDRFTEPENMPAAYAEAWALSSFLLRTRKAEYVRYLKTIAAKPLLIWDEPDQRLAEFEAQFGDLAALDVEFLKYIRRMK